MNNDDAIKADNAAHYNHHKEIPGNPSYDKSSAYMLRTSATEASLRILTIEQWESWLYEGYVVVKNAISREQAKKTEAFLWEFEEKDPNDTSTWYTAPRADIEMKILAGTGMVEAYNHPYFWENRQSKRVYDAFVDIWGMENLWVSIDRANLNFPMRPGFEYKAFIHWDYDPSTKPQNVQGLIALNDQCDEEMGGFQCIPWLYRHYEEWSATQPKDRDRFQPDIRGIEEKIVKVQLEAGDLLIFNSTEPHGIRANRSGCKVRAAQYVSMVPASADNETLRQWRINSWQHRIAPEGFAFPGDPRKWEQTKYPRAELNELGKKLLGLHAW